MMHEKKNSSFSHMPLHLIKISPSSHTTFINCQTYTCVCIPNTSTQSENHFREWTTNDKTTMCSTYCIHTWLCCRHQVYIQHTQNFPNNHIKKLFSINVWKQVEQVLLEAWMEHNNFYKSLGCFFVLKF